MFYSVVRAGTVPRRPDRTPGTRGRAGAGGARADYYGNYYPLADSVRRAVWLWGAILHPPPKRGSNAALNLECIYVYMYLTLHIIL